MVLTDVREAKKLLDIEPGDTSEDAKLGLLITMASDWILEAINRPGIELKSRTEYYNGSGTQKLLLKSRPVYSNPVPQVFVDEGGYWASASGAFTQQGAQLVYGTDFALWIDTDEGKSKNGILVRLTNYWPVPMVRQRGFLSPFVGEGYGNIRVTYTAGYSVDTLPAQLRYAANMLVARMRYVLPLGVELSSDSYEERSMGIVNDKMKLMALVMPLILPFKNWKW